MRQIIADEQNATEDPVQDPSVEITGKFNNRQAS
jgi:hypothetical protein